MGKISEFNVVLHTNRQVYYGREQIAGEVILNLSQPMNVKVFTVECQGKAYCHWTTTTGIGDDKKTDSYSGEEKYFEYVSYLFGDGSSNQVSHPTGRCIYPFAFTHLPTSFEGFDGYIRYEVKAQIKRPWKFDHRVKYPFTVNEVVDPNLPIYREGSGGEEHKEVGCFCCVVL